MPLNKRMKTNQNPERLVHRSLPATSVMARHKTGTARLSISCPALTQGQMVLRDIKILRNRQVELAVKMPQPDVVRAQAKISAIRNAKRGGRGRFCCIAIFSTFDFQLQRHELVFGFRCFAERSRLGAPLAQPVAQTLNCFTL